MFKYVSFSLNVTAAIGLMRDPTGISSLESLGTYSGLHLELEYQRVPD